MPSRAPSAADSTNLIAYYNSLARQVSGPTLARIFSRENSRASRLPGKEGQRYRRLLAQAQRAVQPSRRLERPPS